MLQPLRICSNAENQRNPGKPKTRAAKASRFKGVTWHGGKWRAKVVVEGKHAILAHDELEAAKAYDRAAREHFGEFAWTNEANGLLHDSMPACVRMTRTAWMSRLCSGILS